MTNEFEPIEKDIKDALSKTAQDIEKGYPEHLHGIAERGETVVADGAKKVDGDVESSLKKAMPQQADKGASSLKNVESDAEGEQGKISQILGGEEKSGSETAGGDRQALMDELAQSGVKHDPSQILEIGRNQDGKVVFLEKGNENAGFQHVLNHLGDFQKQDPSLTEEDIQKMTIQAATEGRPTGLFQGKKRAGRPIVEIDYGGQTRRVGITVGNNGFIVGMNPSSSKK